MRPVWYDERVTARSARVTVGEGIAFAHPMGIEISGYPVQAGD